MIHSFSFSDGPYFTFKRKLFLLISEKWHIRWQTETKKVTLTIGKGFITDGASIPRLLWTLVGSPFSGNYRKSAIIHDALYMAQIVTRQQADFLFLHAMKEEGLSWFKRYLIYFSVRVFGGISWHMKDFDTIELNKKRIYFRYREN